MEFELYLEKLSSSNLSLLAKKASVSRQSLHSFLKTKSMRLGNLLSLLKEQGYKLCVSFDQENEDALLDSLYFYRVPCRRTKVESPLLPREECAAFAMKRAQTDGFYESLVTYFLLKNHKDLDFDKLLSLTLEANLVNHLGYYLDMAKEHCGKHLFGEKKLRALYLLKSEEESFLGESEPPNFKQEHFQRNKCLKNWNLYARGTFESHSERWAKWENLAKKNLGK